MLLVSGEVPTKTLYTVPQNVFVDDTASSDVNVKLPQALSEVSATMPPKPTTEKSPSNYFSAQTIDPTSKTVEEELPCSSIGKPCSIFEVKQTSAEPTKFTENSINCMLIGAPCMKQEVDAVHSVGKGEAPETLKKNKSSKITKDSVGKAAMSTTSKETPIVKQEKGSEPVKDVEESLHTASERETCFDTCEAVCVVAGNSCTALKTNVVTSSKITKQVESVAYSKCQDESALCFPDGVPCRDYDSRISGARSCPTNMKSDLIKDAEQKVLAPEAETKQSTLISSVPLDRSVSFKREPDTLGSSSAKDAAKYVSDVLLDTIDEKYFRKEQSISSSKRGTVKIFLD